MLICLKEDKGTSFFLDAQKAYDTMWWDGLWFKVWDVGVKGRMWHVIKKMCEAMQCFERGSAIFRLEQGVVQGSSLSPILFISERK